MSFLRKVPKVENINTLNIVPEATKSKVSTKESFNKNAVGGAKRNLNMLIKNTQKYFANICSNQNKVSNKKLWCIKNLITNYSISTLS